MSKTVDSCLIGKANNFDFIRFYAAVAVIFSHSFRLSKTTVHKEPLRMFSHGKVSFGELSVAIFFIISGLLITQSFDRSKNILSFIQARVLRIYPALIVTILLTVFVVGPIFTTLSLHDYFFNKLILKYLTNVFCVRIAFQLPGMFKHNFLPNAVNGSLWTLPHELACYGLVLAVGLFIAKKYVPAIITAVLIVLFLLNVHTFYFAIGALIYIYRAKIVLNWKIALLCLVIMIVNFHFDKYNIFLTTITGFTLAYLIMYFAFAKISFLNNFSKRGDFSYGIYIWGFVIEQIVALKWPQLNAYYHFLLSFFIALILAILSWHFVEKQALALKKRLKSQPYLLLPENRGMFNKLNLIFKKRNA